MALLKTLSERYPLATAAFLKWLAARNTLAHYDAYLCRPFEDLPVEMMHGVVSLFLEESGILATSRATSAGRWRLVMHVKRISGRFERVEPMKNSMGLAKRQESEMIIGFKLMEQRMRKTLEVRPSQDPSKMFIGIDVSELVARARNNDSACLPN